jgi:2-C-methyl-D-erythritol 4-phosphate cytidylyltransferase
LDPGDREFFQEKFAAAAVMMGVEVAWGGAERWESVQNALTKIRPDLKWVAIHDAARPCLSTVWLDAVLEGAKTTGAAILATPIHGTVKRVDDRQRIETTVPRDRLWQAQTPQVFRYDVLTRAFASRGSLACTDESQLVESLGQAVQVVPGSLLNVKITNKEDLRFAEQALKSLPKKTGFTF